MRLNGILLAVVLVESLTGSISAAANCVDLWMKSLQETQSSGGRRTAFKTDDQFVVCFRLQKDSFVSLWDSPPHGNPSRLYPNALTHGNNSTIRAERLTADQDHCFGQPNSFPLYFPADQGKGEGKLSVIVTESLEDQPALSAYQIPGRTIARERMAEESKRYGIAATCGSKMQEYFGYTIR
jgi:Domain of unknown function (DUF4384)